MNTVNLTKLLHSPSALKKKHMASIESIIEEFPYFQSVRALYLKSLKNSDSYKYNKTLKTTAAYTTDRSILFDFITSDVFLQNTTSEQIKNNHEGIKMLDVSDFQDISNQSSNLAANLNSETEIQQAPAHPKSNASDLLNIGTPLVFDKKDTHSFSQWLQLTKVQPIDRSNEENKTNDKQSKNFDLIDAFIAKNPKIKPLQNEGILKNIAENTATETEQLMTETLARIYVEQKNYDRAIQSYTILSLKYPEKSSLFADQIKALKKLQEKNKNS